MRGQHDRRGPVKPVAALARRRCLLRPDQDRAGLAAALIVAADISLEVAGEYDVGVVGPDRDIAALAAAYLGEVQLGDGTPAGLAGEGDRRVVLLGGVNAVRLAGVGRDMVE